VQAKGEIDVPQDLQMQPAPIEPMERWEQLPGRDPFVRRPLVHLFTHDVLPAAFLTHDPMMEEAMREESPFHGDLRHMWSKSSVACSFTGFWPEYAVMDDERYLKYFQPFVAATMLEKVSSSGVVFWLVTMPSAVAPLEAPYIALVSRSDQPPALQGRGPERRYLLLELGHSTDEAYFCEWSATGEVAYPLHPGLRHLNFGSVGRRTRGEFIEDVGKLLSETSLQSAR
jgi:hypothetical protein